MELLKKGIVFLINIVLGGIFVLIGIFTIHYFILHCLYKHIGGLATVYLQPAMSFLDKKEKILLNIAEFLHFSIDT